MSQSNKYQPFRRKHWHKLDNVANVFPVISSREGSNVYRFSVSLTEEIRPEILQRAVEVCLKHFAVFRVRIRKGLFWYYLDENEAQPIVREENDYACRPIDERENNEFLFRVTYFKNKINLEAFHVLTDGAGAMPFIQAIVCRYLLDAYPDRFSTADREKLWFTAHGNNTEDGYVKNYVPGKKRKFKDGEGYRIKGEENRLRTIAVTHIHLNLHKLLTKCRALDASITQYILAHFGMLFWEIELKHHRPKNPVNIVLPVNLRKMFPSKTSLNFFSNVFIAFDYQQEEITFETLLAEVKRQFKEKITPEKVREKISYTVGTGYSLVARMIPLVLKDLILNLFYQKAAQTPTTAFSNVGPMKFPEIFEPYLMSACALLFTNEREVFKCTAVSLKDTLTLSISSTLLSMELERKFVRYLSDDGLEPLIETNGIDYDSI